VLSVTRVCRKGLWWLMYAATVVGVCCGTIVAATGLGRLSCKCALVGWNESGVVLRLCGELVRRLPELRLHLHSSQTLKSPNCIVGLHNLTIKIS
jgi:hypothetical protein